MLVHVKPKGANWREARNVADLSSAEAAACLDISRQALLNIETNQRRATVSERLARRAARLYRVAYEELVVLDGSGEGVPDDPPSKEQEQETNTGPGRDGSGGTGPGKGGRSGPKRVKGVAA